jgi:pilus assembly protein CpaE
MDGSLVSASAERRSTDRPAALAFVADTPTETALRDGLSEVLRQPLETRRGGIRAAITSLQRSTSPHVLIVDVSGEEQPLTALGTLSDVVEPDVVVLVVGEANDLDFYRAVTRDLGAAEYLALPLTRDTVARHFGPFALGEAPAAEGVIGGRLLTVTGACGGAGASTVAVNLAWHFGLTARRHTVLLDPNVQTGIAAFLLNIQPGSGLRIALEAPERIDALLAERAAHPVGDRLHVLAAEEKLGASPVHAPGAASQLMAALRRRYNFIVADVPFAPVPLYRDLLDAAQQRILVMEPSLAAVRDTLRLVGLPAGPSQVRRPVVVLNRLGRPGGLTRRQIEDALHMKVDVAIPDLPRQIGGAASLGEPAVARPGAFRTAISDLARQVAFTRLLDSASSGPRARKAGDGGAAPRSRWHLFGWRK